MQQEILVFGDHYLADLCKTSDFRSLGSRLKAGIKKTIASVNNLRTNKLSPEEQDYLNTLKDFPEYEGYLYEQVAEFVEGTCFSYDLLPKGTIVRLSERFHEIAVIVDKAKNLDSEDRSKIIYSGMNINLGVITSDKNEHTQHLLRFVEPWNKLAEWDEPHIERIYHPIYLGRWNHQKFLEPFSQKGYYEKHLFDTIAKIEVFGF